MCNQWLRLFALACIMILFSALCSSVSAASLRDFRIVVDPSLTEYQSAVKANPKDPVAHTRLGSCYLRAGNPKAAIKEYKKALKINPQFASAWNNLGVAYFSKGDNKKAAKYYRKATTLQPGMVAALKNLGAALIAMSRYEEGIESYRRALQLDPATLDSVPDLQVTTAEADAVVQYFYLAKLCAAIDRVDTAIEFLRKAHEAGFEDFRKVMNDPDFKTVVIDARFLAMAQPFIASERVQ